MYVGIAVVAILFGYACYRFGFSEAEREYKHLLDIVQYPPGCTCIKNALGANRSCPHHGHLSEFA